MQNYGKDDWKDGIFLINKTKWRGGNHQTARVFKRSKENIFIWVVKGSLILMPPIPTLKPRIDWKWRDRGTQRVNKTRHEPGP